MSDTIQSRMFKVGDKVISVNNDVWYVEIAIYRDGQYFYWCSCRDVNRYGDWFLESGIRFPTPLEELI
jgi:hypothetical protein